MITRRYDSPPSQAQATLTSLMPISVMKVRRPLSRSEADVRADDRGDVGRLRLRLSSNSALHGMLRTHPRQCPYPPHHHPTPVRGENKNAPVPAQRPHEVVQAGLQRLRLGRHARSPVLGVAGLAGQLHVQLPGGVRKGATGSDHWLRRRAGNGRASRSMG
jgi:hypothetical protein